MIDDFIVALPPQSFKHGKLTELDVAKTVLKLLFLIVQQTPLHHHHQQQQQQKEIVALLFFYHKADGTIKQFLPPLRAIMHHFQISGKSLTLLNEALHFPEMMLINLMTFCPIE